MACWWGSAGHASTAWLSWHRKDLYEGNRLLYDLKASVVHQSTDDVGDSLNYSCNEQTVYLFLWAFTAFTCLVFVIVSLVEVKNWLVLESYHCTAVYYNKYAVEFVCRVADLLLAGVVMNRVIQPHESHIPYILQVWLFLASWPYYPSQYLKAVLLNLF